MATEVSAFNGLSDEEDDEIIRIRSILLEAKQRVEKLGRHRNFSLVVTKIEEADLWLNNRRHIPA